MTHGEYVVGINFNPSKDDTVAKIKRAAADLIDLIYDISATYEQGSVTVVNGEVNHLKALAMTHAEDAAVWAVKAATKSPKE